jgi:hypothetical protein
VAFSGASVCRSRESYRLLRGGHESLRDSAAADDAACSLAGRSSYPLISSVRQSRTGCWRCRCRCCRTFGLTGQPYTGCGRRRALSAFKVLHGVRVRSAIDHEFYTALTVEPVQGFLAGLIVHSIAWRFRTLFANAAPDQERPPIEDLMNDFAS